MIELRAGARHGKAKRPLNEKYMSEPEIQVGDRVYTSSRHRGEYSLLVVRETKTRWVTEGESQWNKATLRLVGASVWDSQSIRPMTPELETRICVDQERRAVRNLWRNITDLRTPLHLTSDRLKEILAELKEPTT